jgi:hypothetical protein
MLSISQIANKMLKTQNKNTTPHHQNSSLSWLKKWWGKATLMSPLDGIM